ncbi:sulfatase [uncultured Draconibacterium sp.]|uniref:sulfatase n=1 Tax=uncultured Draconibacterium sp. TaxID=1573823 RepID=UPI0029C7A7F1|nr:sulfatase [uncultured Draconibacterium sp.]
MKTKLHSIFIVFFWGLASCNGAGLENADVDQNQKPNVLFICVDDLRPELGCYGKDYIHSPNIDKLAESGSVFTNHYVQIPTCGASRYSMLTGMLPKTTAELSNEACKKFIAEQAPSYEPETFIHNLKNNGYYTVGIGKISHYPDGLLYGYTEPVGEERELPQSWDELLFNAGKWGTGWNAFFGYASGENRQSLNRQVKPYEKGDVDDYGYVDGMTAALAVRKMKELAQKDKPFFLGVGFFKPHLPFNAPKKYWDLYNEDEISTAPFAGIPENSSTASLHGSGEFNGYQLGDEKASLSSKVSDEYARKLSHAYYACISYTDAQVGKLLDELENLGLAENTIVVIWGDHGWHLGDHMVWGKHTIFERSLNSAFLIKEPGQLKGRKIDNIVSTIDIYPTIMDLCGVEMSHNPDGKSLVPLLKNSINSWENVAYGFYRNGISLRTERYRLTKYYRSQLPEFELYDHQTDPYESNNIAEKKTDIIGKLLPLLEKGNKGIY